MNMTIILETIKGFASLGMAVFMIYLVLTILKIFFPERESEKKDEGLSKKNRNKKLTEQKKDTEQRVKLSKTGICYIVGDYDLSPAMYSLIIRPACGILTAVIYTILIRRFSIAVIPLFILGDIGIHIFFLNLGKRTEKQIEWDIYKALTNINLRLSTGEYFEDCLVMTGNGAIHPRFKEAMDEFLNNINDKSKTMTESIEILKNRFSSERMMTFCKILETFISCGPTDTVFNTMNEELNSMVEDSSARTVNDIVHRYNFSSEWLSIIFITICFMFFNLAFSENEIINNGVVALILRIGDLTGGKFM